MESSPPLYRRGFGNYLGSVLRPKARQWFKLVKADRSVKTSVNASQWLERATRKSRRRSSDLLDSTGSGICDLHDFLRSLSQSKLRVTAVAGLPRPLLKDTCLKFLFGTRDLAMISSE